MITLATRVGKFARDSGKGSNGDGLLDELKRLQSESGKFSLQSRQPVHSVVGRRSAARLLDRGLNCEKLRACPLDSRLAWRGKWLAR